MLNALLPSFDNSTVYTIPLVMAAALAGKATAQNLVQNPSFEDTVNCGVPTQCTLLKSAHWFNPTLSTPDVWDADTARQCGYAIPDPGMGYMLPEDGSRMAGLYFWDGPFGGDSREYIQSKLQDGLLEGSTYQVSLRYVRNPAFGSAVDHIGVWLGGDSLHESTIGPMDLVPQIKLRDPNNPYLINGSDWTQLVDTFSAVGGEQWLIIGNFDPQDSVHAIVADPDAAYANCYYYIDDLVLQALHGAGVATHGKPSAWWDGSNMVISAMNWHGAVVMDVLDAAGRLLVRSTISFTNGRAMTPMDQLATGIYLLRLQGARNTTVVRMVKGEGRR